MEQKNKPKVSLYNEDGNIFMSIESTFNNDILGKCRAIIPKIDLNSCSFDWNPSHSEIRFLVLPCNGAYYEFVDDDFECPPREMTKEEIEEELGYKIKIV